VAVSTHLRDIWNIFNQAGIAEDLAIIESLAFFLLGDKANTRFVPEPTVLPADRQDQVKTLLDAALAEAEVDGDKAKLFDRYLLFRINKMQAGKRYPTPRHLTRWLSDLTEPQPGEKIADLSCGSGGFLVAQPAELRDNPRTGIEIALEWVSLAWANLQLHGYQPNSWRILPGNALEAGANFDEWFKNASSFSREKSSFGLATLTITGPDGQPIDSNKPFKPPYDIVLNNPPFGLNVDRKLAQDASGLATTRSETALVGLSLRVLSETGRAALLVPAGLLFSSDVESVLRKQLIDNGLKAVFALPKEILQPFSQLQTYALLINRKHQTDYIWFWRLNRDGYSSGRGRNLTQEPGEVSDLPLAQALLKADQRETYEVFLNKDRPLFYYHFYNPSENLVGRRGLVLKFGFSIIEVSLEWLPALEKEAKEEKSDQEDTNAGQPTALLMYIQTKQGEVGELIRLNFDQIVPSFEVIEGYTDNAVYKQQVYELKSGQERRSSMLYQGKAGRLAILIEPPGIPTRILGLSVSRKELASQNYDLRPEQYVKIAEEIGGDATPASLLAAIKRNQDKLSGQLNGLLSRLEGTPLAVGTLPSPLLDSDEKPLGRLSTRQVTIWNQVQAKVEKVNSAKGEVETAYPFVSSDLKTENETDAEVISSSQFVPREVAPKPSSSVTPEQLGSSLDSTLELLEKMGLVVPIVLTAANGKAYQFYRRTTVRDRWHTGGTSPEAGAEEAEAQPPQKE